MCIWTSASWVTSFSLLGLIASRPGATGSFQSRAPQITACATLPSEKCAPPKESNRPVPLVCILGPAPLKNTACAPQAGVKSCSRTKKSANAGRRTFFWSSPLKLWARTEIRPIKFRRSPPGYEHDLRVRIVPPKKLNGPESQGVISDEDLFFFWSSLPNLREKFICAPPNIFSAPPSPPFPPPPPESRYSGAGPDCEIYFE